MRDNNTYEVVHTISISTELSNGMSKTISSTFKTVEANSLSDAKRLLNEATPKGLISSISESSIKTSKHKYIEVVNEYIITHCIYIRKNGILYKEISNLEELKNTPMECIEKVEESKPKKEVKSNSKKNNKSKLRSTNKKEKKGSITKSKSRRRPRKEKRTSVDYIK